MVAENIKNIQQRIATVCEKCGRSPNEITLVGVSKTFSSNAIRQVVSAGMLNIGENYVQEVLKKRAELNMPNIIWHFIGHLQRNKVKYIADWVHMIQSVDSLNLGKEISKQAIIFGRKIDVLVEVNTSGEETKFGVTPESTPSLVKELLTLQGIQVKGLMTIGPFLPDPEDSRPAFRTLREIKKHVEKELTPLQHLSMGMTNDFDVAIEEGATILRIGTAIFGERVYSN